MQRNVAALKQGADRDREGLLAMAALAHTRPGALALQGVDAVSGTAERADRPIRPQDGFEVRERGLVVLHGGGGELRGGHDHLPTRERIARLAGTLTL